MMNSLNKAKLKMAWQRTQLIVGWTLAVIGDRVRRLVP